MSSYLTSQWWWLIALFFAWRVFVRLYRLLARQRYSTTVVWARVGTLGLLTIAVAALAVGQSVALIALAFGLLAGAMLGIWGVRLTHFEACKDALYYQPNRYLGLGLSLLLLARVVWRIAAGPGNDATGWTPTGFARNPSTLLLYGLFSGHYLAYALGLMRRATGRIGLGANPEQ